MKKQLPSTHPIQEANELVLALYKNLPQIMQQSLWQRQVPTTEKIEYLKNIAMARRSLMQAVELEYPEVKGRNYTIGNIFVEYQEENGDTTSP